MGVQWWAGFWAGIGVTVVTVVAVGIVMLGFADRVFRRAPGRAPRVSHW